jgi:hypothetical protein
MTVPEIAKLAARVEAGDLDAVPLLLKGRWPDGWERQKELAVLDGLLSGKASPDPLIA